MTELLKYLGGALRRTYDAIVQKPLPWPIIDKLASLDERSERDEADSRESVRLDRTPTDPHMPGTGTDGDAKA
jgi:hypothetical protein